MVRGCQSHGFSSCIECESKFKFKYEFYFNLLCFMLMLCWLSLNKSGKKKKGNISASLCWWKCWRSHFTPRWSLRLPLPIEDRSIHATAWYSIGQRHWRSSQSYPETQPPFRFVQTWHSACTLLVYFYCNAVLSVKYVCTRAPLPLFQGTAHMRWAQSLAYTGHTFIILLLLKHSSVLLNDAIQSSPGHLALLHSSHSQFIICTVLSEFLSTF